MDVVCLLARWLGLITEKKEDAGLFVVAGRAGVDVLPLHADSFPLAFSNR